MNYWNEQHIDIQSRTMGDNLIFHGDAETDNENCEDNFNEFIEKHQNYM